jgi:hypothetical protein
MHQIRPPSLTASSLRLKKLSLTHRFLIGVYEFAESASSPVIEKSMTVRVGAIGTNITEQR